MEVDVWAARVRPMDGGKGTMVSTPHSSLGTTSEACEEKEAEETVLT